jgi:hypothetical protein
MMQLRKKHVSSCIKTFVGLESTGVAREYEWANGKNVTFNGGWCEGEPAGTLKEVYLQATTYCWAEMPTLGWRPNYTSYLCEVHATMTTGQ